MRILIWGCGVMSEAMASGLKQSSSTFEYLTYNPSIEKAISLAKKLSGKIYQPGDQFDVVMLGFKPQKLKEASETLRPLLEKCAQPPLILSLLAAVQLSQLQKHLQQERILRLMPNLLVSKGEGVVLWSGELALEEKDFWQQTLSNLGLAPHVSEKDLDLYTLVAGCSPAYLYYWAQKMVEFMVEQGGDSQLAQAILKQAWMGAAQNLSHDLSLLIKQVASKGGVTEASLEFWQQSHPNYIGLGLQEGLAKIKQLSS